MKILGLGDLHSTERQPPCRKDKMIDALFEKLTHIFNEKVDYFLLAGDIFDTNPPSLYIMIFLMNIINDRNIKIYAVAGQHDLSYHSLKSLNRTGLGVLQEAGYLEILTTDGIGYDLGENVTLYGCHFGQEIPTPTTKGFNILLIHKMIATHSQYPGHEFLDASTLLDKYPNYDLIISGDNHQTVFVQDNKGRVLFNSGSLLRLKADQKTHRPCYGIYDTDTKEFLIDYPPTELGVISDEHLIANIGKNSKELEEFIQTIKQQGVRITVGDMLKDYYENNPIREEVKEIIRESMKKNGN